MTIPRAPVRKGLLSSPLEDLSVVTLLGSRCGDCRETILGVSTLCPNCGSIELTTLPLSREGILWTYTIVRYKPPGDYCGVEPFVPFGLGLVELPEGIRILTPLGTNVDELSIGQSLVFRPTILQTSNGDELIAFEYVPAGTERGSTTS